MDAGAAKAMARSLAAPVGRWLQPDLASPAAPLSTVAWLDSFTPSLMPRTSVLQGIVGGASILAARATASRAERILSPLLGPPTALPRRLGVRAAAAALGAGLAALPEREEDPDWRASLRGAGTVVASIAAGGAIHDVGRAAWRFTPGEGALRTTVATSSVAAGLALWAQRRLHERTVAVEPWPIEQRNRLPEAAAVSAVVVAVGRVIGEGIGLTRRGLRRWLGPAPGTGVVADVITTAAWTAAAAGAYQAAVARVGRADATVEPTYDRAPAWTRVSGSAHSRTAFDELGKQGRRFVSDVLHASDICRVMGEDAVAEPIRVYVGFASEPLHPTGRAEQALEELERTGAYDRRYLLLVSPTGTGWVDQTAVESAELFARGDIATCAVQYGVFPSFLAIQKVALGRAQFRVLLLGVRQRLRAMPPEERPRVLVFGESLGAWTASDVIMHSGIAGFDDYGIDRALWVGLPRVAQWSRSGMIRGGHDKVPDGTVLVIDRPEQIEALGEDARARLRAVILSHDNDPIALIGPGLIVRRPEWLAPGNRGRGVPAEMRWTPLVTFLQTFVDALNSFIQVPGAFTSYGHDYRADMARALHAALDMPPVTATQMTQVQAALVTRDLERARRLRGED